MASEKPCAMPAACHPQGRLWPVKPVALLDVCSSYVDFCGFGDASIRRADG